jgi:hypothetical protein
VKFAREEEGVQKPLAEIYTIKEHFVSEGENRGDLVKT